MDLLKDKLEVEEYLDYYKKIGYIIIFNTERKEIMETLANRTTVLIGQSGVGKSTLLNFLDDSLNLLSQDISLRLGRGKNTTRSVELLEICDGLVADTPGFSVLDFKDMKKEDIRDNMIDFENLKDKCEYKDCMHLKEKKCEIKLVSERNNMLLSRYENYKKFIGEL
jgi:ribosome biogenesis GTPase